MKAENQEGKFTMKETSGVVSLWGINVMVGTMSSSNAVRTYVVKLRKDQGITQETVADALGLTTRAYILWETGKTADIKYPMLVKALKAVQGWVGHLGQLATANEKTARDLADGWLRLDPKERKAFTDLLSEEPGRQQLIRSALEAADDPVLQARLQGYLDGLLGEQRHGK